MTPEELLKVAVLEAAPVDEQSLVKMPSGDVVPFGQIIALTNGEAISWVKLLRDLQAKMS